jgi:hypothetical protein
MYELLDHYLGLPAAGWPENQAVKQKKLDDGREGLPGNRRQPRKGRARWR